jgi:hypothetical protein
MCLKTISYSSTSMGYTVDALLHRHAPYMIYKTSTSLLGLCKVQTSSEAGFSQAMP